MEGGNEMKRAIVFVSIILITSQALAQADPFYIPRSQVVTGDTVYRGDDYHITIIPPGKEWMFNDCPWKITSTPYYDDVYQLQKEGWEIIWEWKPSRHGAIYLRKRVCK